MYKVSLLFLTVAVSAVTALARLPAQYDTFKFHAYELMHECANEHNVEQMKIDDAIDNSSELNLNPCFLGCLFEKTGLINDKGVATPSVAIANLRKYISNGDEASISKALNLCSEKANAESPKDICEAGSLLSPCLLEAYISAMGSKK